MGGGLVWVRLRVAAVRDQLPAASHTVVTGQRDRI